MIYLSGHHREALVRAAQSHPIGLITQPGNRYRATLLRYPWWAIDNGCYSRSGSFASSVWWRWLQSFDDRAKCLFAVAPDVYMDAPATLERARPWLVPIRQLGYRAAYVAQNGAHPAHLPWDDLDVLFLGGDTAWKLSPQAAALAGEARARGKTVHMGRVNSLRRLQAAALMGCSSVDGTFLAYGPDRRLPELVSWLEHLASQPFLELAGAPGPA